MELYKLLAKDNTNQNKNQFLLDHTKMVINFGMAIGDLIYKGEDKDFFLKKLGISLILHDIGKINDCFQNAMLKKGKNIKIDEEGLETIKGVKHNVLSWAYSISRLKGLGTNKNSTKKYSCITSSILWHHNCYGFENYNSVEIIKSLKDTEIKLMDDFYEYFLEYMKETYNISYSEEDFRIEYDFDNMNLRILSEEKLYDKIQIKWLETNLEQIYENDSHLQLIRAILIFSDRLISSGNCDLDKIFNNDIEYITNYFKANSKPSYVEDVNFFDFDYDKGRLMSQFELLNEAMENNHTSIKACAGFGKTLLGLMWFFREKRRLLWVVPINIIAQGTYLSIINELSKMNLSNKLNVGLYYNNTIIHKNCETNSLSDFDILVTNIDSVVKRTTINSEANLLLNMYTSHIIFDEYHQFKMSEPLFSSFIRLMRIRSRHTFSKTLLLSATANNFDCLWGHNIVNYINDTKILYGNTKIKIIANNYNSIDDFIIEDGDNFVINYTVSEAQKCFTENEHNGVKLLHSLFTDEDRFNITKNILDEHGSDSKNEKEKRKTVIGTNIIGTGLNISCRVLYDFIISPETTIQRGCGRCGRFGEYEQIEYHICTLHKKKNNIIENNYSQSLHNKWVNLLNTFNEKIITKNKLYEIYENFLNNNKEEINKYYITLFNLSSNSITDIKYRTNILKQKDNKRHLGNGFGYRGENNSIFVTAKNNDNEWCDPISVDDFILDKESEYGDNSNELRQMIKHNPDRFVYPTNDVLKYKYKINPNTVTKNDLYFIAKNEESPIPLFGFYYSNKLGLVYKNT